MYAIIIPVCIPMPITSRLENCVFHLLGKLCLAKLGPLKMKISDIIQLISH